MRKSILITILCALMAIPSIAQNVKAISGDLFRERVFDYKSDEGWSYKGERACLVDFSTSWA